ncbi:MAG: DUF5020 family protein [Bacteroidales bacterium]|nr:DUF5020 family protein [Bacteroidales bacterium]
MKKPIVLLLILAPLIARAQNFQLHYDFGEDRRFWTATFEMFRPDTLGSTFWFVDLDFDFPGKPRSMSAAYLEFSRDFYIPGLRKNPAFDQLTLHIEYNDGFMAYRDTGNYMGAASFNNIFLTGFSHPLKIGRLVLTTQWLCRISRGMDVPDFQFTAVWFQPVFKGRGLLTGFVDVWSQDRLDDPEKKELVFQTEPQFWYLLTPKIALGGEVEINRNFPFGPAEWKILPTLGFRWEF